MKHFNFFKRRVCSLAALLVMFAFFCSSLHAQTTHNIASGPLTIKKTDGDYIITGSISGTTNTNCVVIETGYKGTVTLKDLTMEFLSEASTAITPPIHVKGEPDEEKADNYAPVTIVNIVLDGDNRLVFHGKVAATFQVDQGAQINISAIKPHDNASGKLFVKSGKNPTPAPAGQEPPSGAAIGAPYSKTPQGWSVLHSSDGNRFSGNVNYCQRRSVQGGYEYATAGGNVIINSGTVRAEGGHGAGIGGGFMTWYNGIIIVTGGDVKSFAGRHAAGLGSGCPTGSGVVDPYADKSAVIALPPCKIEAMGAEAGTEKQKWALAGAKLRIYLNDPEYPDITIHTSDFEQNADIYLDLTRTEGMKEVFDNVHPDFDLTHVWIGKTGTADPLKGKMLLDGYFQDLTTFFTDASSSKDETKGRPYMPVETTTPQSTNSTIILPMFVGDISFTDYPSKGLIEGYSETEAEANAFCIKVEYKDDKKLTDITYELQGGLSSKFEKLIFLADDSSTVINPPKEYTNGLTFYIIAPLKKGWPVGGYEDVILIGGDYNGKPMGGYIRRISAQVVMRDDTDKNEHIKVKADPPSFTELFRTDKTVKLTLNIAHTGIENVTPFNPNNVTAKYIITTEQNYADIATPVDQWEDMVIPQTEGTDAATTVSFKDQPAGTYYIHWHVTSGYITAHSKDVTEPAAIYGGFGKYNILNGKEVFYKGNTNDGGAVPVDATKYAVGDSVAVLGNTGILTKDKATFIGWSFDSLAVVTTLAEVPAILLNANEKFEILTDTELYAVWAADSNGPNNKPDSVPDYDQFNVIYHGNNHTSGTIPEDKNLYSSGYHVVTKLHGDLKREDDPTTAILFAGWAPTQISNVLTQANAVDTTSAFVREGNTFEIMGNTTMYAVWSTDENGNNIPDIFENGYKVAYNGNGHTEGTEPTDATVYLINTIAIAKSHGDLKRTGGADPILFAGWTPTPVSDVLTAANAADTTSAFVRSGNPFTITGNVTMYAVWSTDGNGNNIPDIFETEYNVTYDGNGATGTAPSDATNYLSGMTVTVLGNTGPLTKTDATFIGWSFGPSNLVTAPAEEPGDLMQPDTTFIISGNTMLYAVWAIDKNGPGGGKDSVPDYKQFTVTYHGNGHTSGSVPKDNKLYSHGVFVTTELHGNLEKSGTPKIVFAGWAPTQITHVLTSANAADTTSAFVREGNTFEITGNTTMYAVWSTDGNGNNIPDIFEDGYKVTYDGNSQTSGDAPEDNTEYLTGMKAVAKAKGNLAKNDAIFIGWSTENTVVEGKDLKTMQEVLDAKVIAVDSAFAVPTDMLLYAVWAADVNGPGGEGDNVPDYLQFAVIYDGNGETDGEVIDGNIYNKDMNVVLKDKGNLVKTDRVFLGWNRTQQNDLMTVGDYNDFILLGTMKKGGETFVITEKTTWYAVWAKDENGNGIPDYLEIEIIYHWGAMDGPVVRDTVESGVAFPITDMGFNDYMYGYVIIGWHEMNVPIIVSTLAMENSLNAMPQFHAVGSSLSTTKNMDLYAIWARDANNDGYPDYGGSIVRPQNGTRNQLLSGDDATGNDVITGARVWAHGSTMYINTDKAVRASIYTIGGTLYKQMDIPEGLTSESLKAGIYIVEMEGVRYKVVVK